MAFYHDYKTGKRKEVGGPLVREDAESAWPGFILVIAIIVGACALAFGHFGLDGDQQIARSTIDQPVETARP